jgi:hypothetical protein
MHEKPLTENSRSCRCECPALVRLLRTTKVYKATHMKVERREKSSRVVFEVKLIDNGQSFECECWQHCYDAKALGTICACYGVGQAQRCKREVVDKGMQILKDGIVALAEFEYQRDGLALEDRS